MCDWDSVFLSPSFTIIFSLLLVVGVKDFLESVLSSLGSMLLLCAVTEQESYLRFSINLLYYRIDTCT